ncbi:NADH-quinone oxidoreductase subunit J [Candidatus Poriferisodalis sp.]|uniref:NADH-quinone oxidoreductase subunit J n=1 Tax=Candidatus Poriferisodalis sp. TaxID=3101277 RepID=UPI003B020691
MVEVVVFAVAGAACLVGAVGVVLSRNPVHAALMLVMTLFGIAVLFVALQAHFIAAVQVIVYAGAIVVLFLFVIMLLGVDRAAELSLGALPAQRWTAAAFGIGGAAVLVWLVAAVDRIFKGTRSYELEQLGIVAADADAAATSYATDVSAIARSLFSDYVYAFELTSLLLIVAVIGTVILARRSYGADGRRAGQHGGSHPPSAESSQASEEARQ